MTPRRILSALAAAGIGWAAVGAGCSSNETSSAAGQGGSSASTTVTSTGGGSTSSSSATSSSSSSAGSGGSNPAPPTLGTQIDRFGRPAINTALDHVFDTDMTAKGAAKDAYNAAADPATWVSSYEGEFEKNLAILDALDTVCGNQLLADKTKTDASRYKALADVLGDDRMWLNTAGTSCTTYLAVEANALGVTNTDCGGRALGYDVIDASYTLLATGALDGSVGDGVPADADASSTTFPYLAKPH